MFLLLGVGVLLLKAERDTTIVFIITVTSAGIISSYFFFLPSISALTYGQIKIHSDRNDVETIGFRHRGRE